MWYDLVVLGILLFFTLRGAQKGIIWQLAGIAGIILCVVFSQSISAMFGPYVKLDPPLNNWVVMFGAYLAFTFLSFGLGKMLDDWIEKSNLEHFNSHLGALFGFLKGSVLVLVMTFFAVTLSPASRDALKNSKTGIVAAKIIDTVHPYIPENLHNALDDYIHKLDTPEMEDKYANENHPTSGGDVDLGAPNPLGGIPGFPTIGELAQNSGGQPTTSAVTQADINSLLSRLPASIGPEFRQELSRQIASTPPEDQIAAMTKIWETLSNARPEEAATLRQQLTQGGIASLKNVATNWLNSNLPSTPVNPPVAPPVQVSNQERYLIDISKRFSSLPSVQANIQNDLRYKLNGFDPLVQEAVLRDWRYDLYRPVQEQDPDNGTTAETPIEVRIVRELERLGIPLSRLSLDLQNRLQGGSVR
ncbi:MAG: CvpA family protein [Planctomycetaceae bacterium]